MQVSKSNSSRNDQDKSTKNLGNEFLTGRNNQYIIFYPDEKQNNHGSLYVPEFDKFELMKAQQGGNGNADKNGNSPQIRYNYFMYSSFVGLVV